MLLIVFSISLCFPWVYADSNSLTVLYMAVSGIDDFPDVMNIAIVKGIQLNYHDTKIRRMIPRQKFMENSFGVETWNAVTDIANSHSTIAKESLHTIMKGMNQTSDSYVTVLAPS